MKRYERLLAEIESAQDKMKNVLFIITPRKMFM